MIVKKCPYCQDLIEVSDLWECFDCPSCQAQLKIENGEIQKLDSSLNTSSSVNQEPLSEEEKDEIEEENYLESKNDEWQEGTPNPSFMEEKDNDEVEKQSLLKTQSGFSNQVASKKILEEELFRKNQEVLEKDSEEASTKELHSNQDVKILYDLMIQVSQENLVKIRQILENKRLNLNAQELLSQMQEGSLKIENLNPVKASFLVRSLSQLPIHVQWVQKK